jgi:F-type H+-transporting ATPase subunit b
MQVETDTATTHSVENAAEASAASVGEHGATTGAEHSSGLPQFQFEHWGGQIAYLLILFVALYILMAKVFGPRMRRVFDERETTIRDALSSARTVQAQAESQAEAAKRALADARAAAQNTASEAAAKAAAEAAARRAELDAELSQKQAEAEAQIRAARNTAMQQLATVATDTAEAMIEKITGAKAPRAAVAAAVSSQVQ